LFRKPRYQPDLNAMAEEIQWLAAAVAWLCEREEATMPTLQQIVDEITQQRSVLNAVAKLMENIKAAIDDVQTADAPTAALAELQAMIEAGSKDIAEAVEKVEHHSEPALEEGEVPNLGTVDDAEPPFAADDDDEPDHPTKPRRRRK